MYKFGNQWYNGKLGKFIPINWSFYNIFEIYMHAYRYDYKFENDS